MSSEAAKPEENVTEQSNEPIIPEAKEARSEPPARAPPPKPSSSTPKPATSSSAPSSIAKPSTVTPTTKPPVSPNKPPPPKPTSTATKPATTAPAKAPVKAEVKPEAKNGTTPATTTAVKKENGVTADKKPVPIKKEGENKEAKTEAKKRKKEDESDSDSDSDSEDSDSESDTPLDEKAKAPATKPAPKAAAPPAKRQATVSNGTSTAAKKPAAPAAKPAATKKKVKEESSSSDSSSDSSDSSDDTSDSDSSDTSSGSDEEGGEGKRPAKAQKRSRGDSAASDAKLNNVKNYEIRAENVPLKAELGANKWWNRLTKKNVKWQTLTHNGPRFPLPYATHGVSLLYDGQTVKMTPDTEEVATYYAQMIEAEISQKPIFRKNFFRDWRSVMTEAERTQIKTFEKCDFTLIHKYVLAEKEKKAELRVANREQDKIEKTRMDAIYGFACVDGYLEKVGNYRVEPPSLFRGRGEHPKTGMLKRRVRPEDVVINIGKGVQIPRPPEGHTWKGVVHNNKVTWLAFWQDNINKDFKYVYLAAASRFKGESDIAKYAKAMTLIQHIGTIRKKYNAEMTDKDRYKQQLAVALYALDVLALRVGNEKDTDNRADTVGLCSLRVEHITFPCPEEFKVRLNFLGKDSMVYDNTFPVPPDVYKNLVSFTKGKKPKDDLFEKLDPTKLNGHLKDIMPGLSAKVFRTYNASITLEQELEKGDISVDAPENEKVIFYNKANTTVAILCNHQRSIPKAHVGQMEKMEEAIAALYDELKQLKKDRSGNRGKIEKLEEKIEKKEHQKSLKSATATVALGTSKINYMDPRVTVAWCKKVDLPLEKVFNPALIQKFPWAMEVPSTWRFDPAKNPKNSAQRGGAVAKKKDDDKEKEKEEEEEEESSSSSDSGEEEEQSD